jgi:long-chain acyl-CoA synthetase
MSFTAFSQILAQHRQSDPHGVAFRVDDQYLTWLDLHEKATRVAAALIRQGVCPGESVAVLAFPSLDYVVCFFGALAARACVVPLPASATAQTLHLMLADSAAKLLFLDSALEFKAPADLQVVEISGIQQQDRSLWSWMDDISDHLKLPDAQAEDPFNIIYSSGTTGAPKGIVHLHEMRQRQALRNGFGFSRSSRTLLSTPMYSNTTIAPMLGTVAHGGQCILMRKFDASAYLQIAAREQVTHTMLVPIQYKRLLAHAAFDAPSIESLQVSLCTGAPMDSTLKREILVRWPGKFLEIYGLTEGGVSCILDAHAYPDKLGTVGKPAYGTEVFLLDEKGLRTSSSEGEICGRSPFMMAGYHQRPEANKEIRWLDEEGRICHRTGDIGRLDEDGFVTLLDRRKDIIISGGNNVYAADLEAILMQHPAVADCAVIGVPSEAWGETPLALVIPRPGCTADTASVCDWVNQRVGKTQRLSAVEFRAELARSQLGKLSKKELRAAYWVSNK